MRNLKFIPTWKIIEILDEPYNRGVNGKDYGPVKEELEKILWERQNRDLDNRMERELEENYKC